MIRTVLALFAPIALLWPVGLHAESNGLADKDVSAAMSSNPELNGGKTYGRVDFHVLDDKGEVVHVESIFPQQNEITPLSYSIGLPSSQRCPATSPVTVGAGTWVQWCDPGNRNKLQSDIYQLTFSGTKGSYLISYKEIDCITEKPNIPPNIFTALCM